MYLKRVKCKFHQMKVTYLDLIIGTREVHMDPEKMAAVRDWPVLNCVFNVNNIRRFVNLY